MGSFTMAAFRLIGALEPGSTITSLEGVDLKGEKAVIVDVEGGGKGKSLVTLFFPRLKSTKQYRIPSQSVTKTVKKSPHPINPETVDELRLNSPGRSTLPMRENLPDSILPQDPTSPSTLTDVLTRPTIRRTMYPRFYHFQKNAASRELHKELKEVTALIKSNLPVLRKAMLRLNHILRTWESDGLQQGTWNLIDDEKLYRKVTEGLAQMENLVKRRQEILRRLGKES